MVHILIEHARPDTFTKCALLYVFVELGVHNFYIDLGLKNQWHQVYLKDLYIESFLIEMTQTGLWHLTPDWFFN